ncbi:MAG TPA: HAMP domain-containing sensor histidine kinase [Terriglobales bacterium]|nr:HAMP domain-containing sensor histidine kinase [Terriglobales bacterium]
MAIASRRGAIIFFLSLGVFLAGIAIMVGFGWIILNWRYDLKVVLGVIFFGAIAAGLILNTSFLVREIRRNEQHDSFINAVTHELKTPITSIRLYLQTLQRRDVEESQRQEFYRLMAEDADRLQGTVEQVLKAGEAGHKSSKRAPLDFGRLVRECVESARLSHHLPPEAVRFELLSTNGTRASMIGDGEELRTAVSNVLENAIKYSGGKVEVCVRLQIPDEKHISLTVQDHGVGIPAPELKRIFRRFYRVHNLSLRGVKGTGLGLFIVRSIVRKHGGHVFAESEGEGQGTTIHLELPRRVA